MNIWHSVRPIVLVVALLSCPVVASAGAYTVNAGGERLEFVPQVQKGYVIKLAQKAGGIHALAGLSVLDAEDAREVRGLDRRGVWTVENEGPAGRNEDTIRSLRASSQVAYAAPLFSSNGETVAIIPEIVVRVKPGTSIEQVQMLCETAGCTIKKRMEFTEQEYLIEVQGPDAEAVFAAVGQLSQAAYVEWACPNTAFRLRLSDQAMAGVRDSAGQLRIAAAAQDANSPGVFPNDEYFPKQWHLHNTGQSGGTPGADIRAPEAWEITTGDPNIVISIVDHGIDSSHPDLVGNVVAGYDFWDDDDAPEPGPDTWYGEDPHGTACAGLLAASGNNGIGVAGVTWGCKIIPIRVDVGGDMPTNEADIATALRWAAAQGADILSNSWGFYGPLPLIHAAIVDVTAPGGIGRNGKGCAALFSAGNNTAFIWWPAVYSEVIAVGATKRTDLRASFSCYGPELDVAAPGADVWTTDISGPLGYSFYGFFPPLDYYGSFSGTSASTPIAAGVAALILSVEPNLTSVEVRHFLERSAKDLGDPGRDEYYGWGRVDARAALDMVLAKRADLNNDWKVDEEDRAILLKAMDANDLSADIGPAAKRDGVVDANDLELLTRYLGTVIPELGLIAYWKLNETEGTIVHDSSGKRHDASVMGPPLWQPEGGKVGGALELDGVGSSVTAKPVLDPSQGPLSVFAWVKGGAPGKVILSQAGGANWLMAAADGSLRTDLKSSDSESKALSSVSVITDDVWHQVGFVWDGSNRILYVDDIEVARDTQTELTGSTGNLYIGAGSTMSPASFWKGLIDDVRIYDRGVKP